MRVRNVHVIVLIAAIFLVGSALVWIASPAQRADAYPQPVAAGRVINGEPATIEVRQWSSYELTFKTDSSDDVTAVWTLLPDGPQFTTKVRTEGARNPKQYFNTGKYRKLSLATKVKKGGQDYSYSVKYHGQEL